MERPEFQQALGLIGAAGGVSTGPQDAFAAMLGAQIKSEGHRWEPPQSMSSVSGAEPPTISDVSSAQSTMSKITTTFKTPSFGYDHVAEMQSGMLAFSVRRQQLDADETLILALHQVNAAMREQWDEFVSRTSGNSYDNEAKEMLELMQKFGDRGLDLAEHEQQNCGCHETIQALARYRELALQDDFCYLTSWGIRQRIKYVGPIVTTTRERTLDDMGRERYGGTSSVVVGSGRRVECTQLFGSLVDIPDGARLWLICTRRMCSSRYYGAFEFRPGGGGCYNMPMRADRVYRDESGKPCEGRVRFVGTVNRSAMKESSGYAILQACNLGTSINNDAATNMHASLPLMHINSGIF